MSGANQPDVGILCRAHVPVALGRVTQSPRPLLVTVTGIGPRCKRTISTKELVRQTKRVPAETGHGLGLAVSQVPVAVRIDSGVPQWRSSLVASSFRGRAAVEDAGVVVGGEVQGPGGVTKRVPPSSASGSRRAGRGGDGKAARPVTTVQCSPLVLTGCPDAGASQWVARWPGSKFSCGLLYTTTHRTGTPIDSTPQD
jgi:hypothetical protein